MMRHSRHITANRAEDIGAVSRSNSCRPFFSPSSNQIRKNAPRGTPLRGGWRTALPDRVPRQRCVFRIGDGEQSDCAGGPCGSTAPDGDRQSLSGSKLVGLRRYGGRKFYF